MSTGLPAPPPLDKPRIPGSGITPHGQSTSLAQALDQWDVDQRPTASTTTSAGDVIPDPSPFLALSDLSLPDNMRDLYRLVQKIMIWSSVHKAWAQNMACLPITRLIVRSRRPVRSVARDPAYNAHDAVGTLSADPVADRVQELLDKHMKIDRHLKRCGIDYWSYGFSVTIMRFPFLKYLRCARCNQGTPIHQIRWTLRVAAFAGCCPLCGHDGEMTPYDIYTKEATEIRPVKLHPLRIIPIPSDWTGDIDLYYEIPERDVKRVTEQRGFDREFVETLPQTYLDAILERTYEGVVEGVSGPLVRLRRGTYHLMVGIGQEDEHTGMPVPEATATLKEYWLMRALQRGQEAAAVGFITPKPFVNLVSGAINGNLFSIVNGPSLLRLVREEVARSKGDPGYIAVFPCEVGTGSMGGGEAKAIMVASEIRVQMELMCAGLNSPLEFIFGGLSYSGSDVSVQQLYRRTSNYRRDQLDLTDWITRQTTDHLEWVEVLTEMEPFRLGTDMQFLQFLSSLAIQRAVSMRRLYQELRYNPEQEREDILEDVRFSNELATLQAKAETRAAADQARAQARAAGQGQVLGREAQLRESLGLAERIRNDDAMYAHVMQLPDLAMEIFGPAAVPFGPEPARGQSTGWVPEEVAPGVATDPRGPDARVGPPTRALDAVVHDAPPVPGMVGLDAGSPPPPEQGDPSELDLLPDELIARAAAVAPEQWPAFIAEVTQAYGDEAGRRMGALLSMATAELSTAPHHKPPTRQNSVFGGRPGGSSSTPF